MDLKYALEYKSNKYKNFRRCGNNKYNYEENGILRLCLSKILFKGNPILVTFLQLIDLRLIIFMKYIEKIRHFKHVTWYQ